jgi:hypothetical protein
MVGTGQVGDRGASRPNCTGASGPACPRPAVPTLGLGRLEAVGAGTGLDQGHLTLSRSRARKIVQIRLDVHPEQRGQGAFVLVGEEVCPLRIGEHVLDHQGVNEDQRRLQEVECENREFLLVTAVAAQLPALAEEDDVVGAVPALDDVEPFLDLALKVAVAQIAGDFVESDLSTPCLFEQFHRPLSLFGGVGDDEPASSFDLVPGGVGIDAVEDEECGGEEG